MWSESLGCFKIIFENFKIPLHSQYWNSHFSCEKLHFQSYNSVMFHNVLTGRCMACTHYYTLHFQFDGIRKRTTIHSLHLLHKPTQHRIHLKSILSYLCMWVASTYLRCTTATNFVSRDYIVCCADAASSIYEAKSPLRLKGWRYKT